MNIDILGVYLSQDAINNFFNWLNHNPSFVLILIALFPYFLKILVRIYNWCDIWGRLKIQLFLNAVLPVTWDVNIIKYEVPERVKARYRANENYFLKKSFENSSVKGIGLTK